MGPAEKVLLSLAKPMAIHNVIIFATSLTQFTPSSILLPPDPRKSVRLLLQEPPSLRFSGPSAGAQRMAISSQPSAISKSGLSTELFPTQSSALVLIAHFRSGPLRPIRAVRRGERG